MKEPGGTDFKVGSRRWPDRSCVEIFAVTERLGQPVFWYTETDTGNKDVHVLPETEYVEIGGKKYTVADGTDRISAALDREIVKNLLERM